MPMELLFGRSHVRAPWIELQLALINALLLRRSIPLRTGPPADLAFDSYQRLQPRTYNPRTPASASSTSTRPHSPSTASGRGRDHRRPPVDKLTEKGAAVIAFDVLFSEPDRLIYRAAWRARPRGLHRAGDGAQAAAAVQDESGAGRARMAKSPRRAGLRLRPRGRAGNRRAAFMARPSPATIPAQFLPMRCTVSDLRSRPPPRAMAASTPTRKARSSAVCRCCSGWSARKAISGIVDRGAAGRAACVDLPYSASGASREMSLARDRHRSPSSRRDRRPDRFARPIWLHYDTGRSRQRYLRPPCSAGWTRRRPTRSTATSCSSAPARSACRTCAQRRSRQPCPGRGPCANRRADHSSATFWPARISSMARSPLFLSPSAPCLVILLPRRRLARCAPSRRSSSPSAWPCPGSPSRTTSWCSIRSSRRPRCGDLCQWHRRVAFMRHRARTAHDPQRLRPLRVADRGRAAGAQPREAGARRRAARADPDVLRHPQLHDASRKFDAARADRVHQRFSDADDRHHPDRSGTIDKYMGDAIMAFWNAPLDDPDHAAQRPASALEMQRRWSRSMVNWQAEPRRQGRAVHAGQHRHRAQYRASAVVGNLGSHAAFRLFGARRRGERRLAARRLSARSSASTSSAATSRRSARLRVARNRSRAGQGQDRNRSMCTRCWATLPGADAGLSHPAPTYRAAILKQYQAGRFGA